MDEQGTIYAIAVVVEADSREEAFDRISDEVGPEPANAHFVGEPFEIERADEYDSRSVAEGILDSIRGELRQQRLTEEVLDGDRFGEIELDPFRVDSDTGEAPEGTHRLDRLPDGALFEDAQGRLFNVVRQGPTQGATEIVDDDETHAYWDCGTLVKLHEEQQSK